MYACWFLVFVCVCVCVVGTIIDQRGDGSDASKGPVTTSSDAVKAPMSQQRLEDLDKATAGDPPDLRYEYITPASTRSLHVIKMHS